VDHKSIMIGGHQAKKRSTIKSLLCQSCQYFSISTSDIILMLNGR